MACFYELSVDISRSDSSRCQEIQAALVKPWGFTRWEVVEGISLRSSTRCYIDDNDSEETVARRIRDAIWVANGKPCVVDVHTTYLSDLPYTSYAFDTTGELFRTECWMGTTAWRMAMREELMPIREEQEDAQ